MGRHDPPRLLDWSRYSAQEGLREPKDDYERNERRIIGNLSAKDRMERNFLIAQMARIEQVYKQFGRGLENFNRREGELKIIRQETQEYYKQKENIK